MNSALRPKLEVIFAESGICESREQCTGRTQGNTDAGIAMQTRCYPNPQSLTMHRFFE